MRGNSLLSGFIAAAALMLAASPLRADLAVKRVRTVVHVAKSPRCAIAWTCKGELCRERPVCEMRVGGERGRVGTRFGVYRPYAYFGPYADNARPYWTYRPWGDGSVQFGYYDWR